MTEKPPVPVERAHPVSAVAATATPAPAPHKERFVPIDLWVAFNESGAQQRFFQSVRDLNVRLGADHKGKDVKPSRAQIEALFNDHFDFSGAMGIMKKKALDQLEAMNWSEVKP